MSQSDWLDNHLSTFILPNLRMIRLNQRNITRGRQGLEYLTPVKYEAVDLNLFKPAKDTISPRAGILKTALRSWAPKGEGLYRPFEIFGSGDYIQKVLLSNAQHEFRTIEETVQDEVHSFIKSSLRSLKARLEPGARLILFGRDVWLWAVLAEKMGVPYLFDPRISRLVSYNCPRYEIEAWGLSSKDIFFDTGFVGSILKNLSPRCPEIPEMCLLSYAHNRQTWYDRNGSGQAQLFPEFKKARNFALAIEYLPKYYSMGTIRQGEIVQALSPLSEFVDAALLTIWAWEYRSPKFFKKGTVPSPNKIRNPAAF